MSEVDDVAEIPTFEQALDRYYGANGPGFAAVDIHCCGTRSVRYRIGAIVRVLEQHISHFVIIVPPYSEGGDIDEEQIWLAIAPPTGAAPRTRTEISTGARYTVRLVRSADLGTQWFFKSLTPSNLNLW